MSEHKLGGGDMEDSKKVGSWKLFDG